MESTESARSGPSRRPDGNAPRLLLIKAVVAAMAAGGAAWVAGEATRETFRPTAKAAEEPYAFAQFNAEKDRADGRNAAIVYGTLGALTGLALGLVAGWSARGLAAGVVAGLVGAILGGVAAALPCPWVVPLYRRHYDPAEPSLILPALIHAAIWTGLGLAAGAGLGLGLGGGRKVAVGALGGALAAALATVLYEALVAVLFASEFVTDAPVSPHGPARLLACLLVPVFVAFGACWAAREPRPRPAA